MVSELKIAVLIGLVCMNVIGFVMTGLDKYWAIRQQWRVAEKCFFKVAIIGGGLGIFLGCFAFHHKIRNRAFMMGIPFVFTMEAGFAFLLFHYLGA